ncbi:hypothetical protein BDQ17DRAFT_1333451 [Cyathus striatus]|nr:hypothetical protein BDQ17DRAFT_1333451 [Cyathus striatus]
MIRRTIVVPLRRKYEYEQILYTDYWLLLKRLGDLGVRTGFLSIKPLLSIPQAASEDRTGPQHGIGIFLHDRRSRKVSHGAKKMKNQQVINKIGFNTPDSTSRLNVQVWGRDDETCVRNYILLDVDWLYHGNRRLGELVPRGALLIGMDLTGD